MLSKIIELYIGIILNITVKNFSLYFRSNKLISIKQLRLYKKTNILIFFFDIIRTKIVTRMYVHIKKWNINFIIIIIFKNKIGSYL